MEMMLHYLTLNCTPQVLLHWVSLSRCCCSMWHSARVLTSRYRRQSSANRRIDEDVSEAMSLMKMRKSKGPWGTPDITGASLEVNPSTTTLWFLHDRNDSILPMMSLSRVYCFSFCKRRWWGTLSKYRFRMVARSWDVMISCDSQERRRLDTYHNANRSASDRSIMNTSQTGYTS